MNWYFISLLFFVVLATYNHFNDLQDPDQLITFIQNTVVRIVFIGSVIFFAEVF